jgi:hypothetical protein
MRIALDDLGFLDCIIEKYSCNLYLNYKNITVDQKTIASILRMLTPEYTSDLLSVFTQDGLNLYIYHKLYKHLKDEAIFMPLTFWNSTEVLA